MSPGIRGWGYRLLLCPSALQLEKQRVQPAKQLVRPANQLCQQLHRGLDILGLEQEQKQHNDDGAEPTMALELAENACLEFVPARGQGGRSRR